MNKEILLSLKVDRRYGLELGLQVAQSLRNLILENKVHYNEELPPARELAALLEIDVSDIEHAYQHLTREKVLTERYGKYIVSYFELVNRFHQKMITLHQAIEQLGMTATIQTLIHEVITVNADLALRSGYSVGDKVLRLKRIYLGDGIPLIIYDGYLNLKVLPGIERMIDAITPYYPIIVTHYQKKLGVSKRKLVVRLLPLDVVDLFKVPKGSPSYFVSSSLFSNQNELLEFGESFSSPNYYFQYEHLAY